MPSPAVPDAAALLTAFVNTRQIDTAEDQIATAPALAAWLTAHGLLDPPAPATDTDLQVAQHIREALRAVLLTHHHPGPHDADADTDLDALARDLPLRVTFGPGGPHLAPLDDGVRGALAALLAAAQEARLTGAWARMKACPADTCHWAFYDTSKNQSRTWCSMQVCGNRAKTRAYRARHGTGDTSTGRGPAPTPT